MKKEKTYLMLPKDRHTILKWCRFFYNTDPYIYCNINAAVETVKIRENKKITKNEKLRDLVRSILLDVLKTGEAFVWGKLDKTLLLEPEYINICKSIFNTTPVFKITPNNEMRHEVKIIKGVPKKFKDKIIKGEDFVIENINHIINRAGANDLRGTSVIQTFLKDLYYEDQIRLQIIEKGKCSKSNADKLLKIKKVLIKQLAKNIKGILNFVFPQVEKCIKDKMGFNIKLESAI